VSGGILFYLYLARVSVPLLGTNFVFTPEISGLRSIVHAVLSVTFFYLGFIRKWKTIQASDFNEISKCGRQGAQRLATPLRLSQRRSLSFTSIMFHMENIASLTLLMAPPSFDLLTRLDEKAERGSCVTEGIGKLKAL
jgi:hypothetical protein